MCVKTTATKRADFSNFWHMRWLEAVIITSLATTKETILNMMLFLQQVFNIPKHYEQKQNSYNAIFTDEITFHISDGARELFDSKHKRLNRTHSKREDDLMDNLNDRTHLSARASLACSVWFHWCCGEPWKTHSTSYCCLSLIRPRLDRTHETMQTPTEEVEVWIIERMDFLFIHLS